MNLQPTLPSSDAISRLTHASHALHHLHDGIASGLFTGMAKQDLTEHLEELHSLLISMTEPKT